MANNVHKHQTVKFNSTSHIDLQTDYYLAAPKFKLCTITIATVVSLMVNPECFQYLPTFV